MFKQVARTVASALNDPWVQGIFGLMLLARATNGMNQQLSELQEAIRATHELNTKAYMDFVESQKPNASANVASASENVSATPQPAKTFGEYFSSDARTE